MNPLLRGKSVLRQVPIMILTRAPCSLLIKYFMCVFTQRRHERYREQQASFREKVKSMDESHDWFTDRIPSWLDTIDRFDLRSRDSFHAMEIGSFQGMSAIFLLEQIPNASIVCVDPWQSEDAHEDTSSISKEEARFDRNTAHLADRITKFKGTSFSFFEQLGGKPEFDFIYIDGAHHADNVLLDAIMGFDVLRVGGIMIFDDYVWKMYRNLKENPAYAINTFLKMKRGKYRLLHVGGQVQLQKCVAQTSSALWTTKNWISKGG